MVKTFYVKMKKNNSGMSLMEMIVVVAIMGVLIALTSIGIGMVSTKPAAQCASNLELSLNRCRIQTMGKTNGLIGVVAESDGVYIVEKYDYSLPDDYSTSDLLSVDGIYSKKLIGKNTVSITFNGAPLSDGAAIIEFNRSDGSVKTPADKNEDVFVITKGRRSYTVSVQKLTGKVSLSKS